MAVTYLPAPIKVQNNRINKDPDLFLYAGSSIALGILSYYAPKAFVATSVGIFAYQIYRFNQLVHTADDSKHQQIHAWAIKACMVMWSIGSVFMIKSLPSFWSAAKDLRHLQLIHCIGHLAKGAMMMLVGVSTSFFYASAKDLAKCRRWVEMEDYVENYPAEVKQELLSSYREQLWFYISALLPRTGLATFVSKFHVARSQFQPEHIKFSILQTYFSNKDIETSKWPLAIHQFQQLSTGNQLPIAPDLVYKARLFSNESQDRLPDDVKVVILNETLKEFNVPLTVYDLGYQQWQAFADAFEKLSREQQSILGEEFLRLIQNVPKGMIGDHFSEPMRLAVLKASDKSLHIEGMESLEAYILDGLSEPFKEEYRVFYRNTTESIVNFTRQKQRAVISDGS